MNVELAIDARAELGEGPFWHPRENRLYWVDIEGGSLHVHDPEGVADTAYDVGCRVGVAVPRRSGGLMLGTDHGFESFDLTTATRTPVVDPESDLPDNRFNDGKCDCRGRFWAGSMCLAKRPEGNLYVLEADGTVRRAIQGVTTSNGLAWSLDQRTMFYIDTPTMQVSAFDYDAGRGTIANRRAVIRFPQNVGRPDGMTIDAEGMLWIAHWAGARVSRWNPATGALLATVAVPAANVTSCAFGGKNLDRLYVTTARHKLDAEALARYPHSGGVFVLRPGVCGLAANEYAG